jgi:antitoxin VapB
MDDQLTKARNSMYHGSHHRKERTVLKTAKVFVTGRSQAVRLPLEFRFDGPEVFIRRDPATGDVVLSGKPTNWQGLLDAVAQNADQDFVLERRPAPQTRRDPFEGWKE